MPMAYGNGTNSSIGPNHIVAAFERQAVSEIQDEMYFSQMGSPVRLPKNQGRTIEAYVEIPIIDDRNKNDQGIDPAGKRSADGNLYGSTRNVGSIESKMPLLAEKGGKQNRVGLTRSMISSTIQNFGIYLEFTENLQDFESRGAFHDWAMKKMVAAANKVHEDQMQLELLAAAAIRKYAGKALKDTDMDETCIVEYGDLSRLAVDLDNTHTPRNTRILSGSSSIDTRTVNSARVAFVGTEIQQDFKRMKDYHDSPAFISVEKYASQDKIIRSEVGAIDAFRFVSTNTMMKWAGAGKTVTDDKGIYTTNGKADIFPILVVGDDSFNVITFKADGKNTRFRTIVHAPGTYADRSDPFGKIGYMSIQWWHGVLIKRPERIALLKTTVRR